jgi:hypothetical protein
MAALDDPPVIELVIGVAVTELSVWGHRQQLTATRRAGYLDGINTAAQAVATGSSASVLIEDVSRRLVRLLSLRSCAFEPGVAGLGRPARLRSDGQVEVPGRPDVQPVERDCLPATTELLVENRGVLQGRFLMTAESGSRPTVEQRLVAVADQVGAALAASPPITA